MVIGIDKFREYFKDVSDSYIIIGDTACDIILEDAGFTPRATKDIDMILIVEALKPEFVKQFWAFIKEADYERKEKSEDKRKYYRFLNPENKEFPKQVELFSKTPDLIKVDMQNFVDVVKNDLPNKQMFKDLGIPNMNVDVLFKQFLSNFKLEIE